MKTIIPYFFIIIYVCFLASCNNTTKEEYLIHSFSIKLPSDNHPLSQKLEIIPRDVQDKIGSEIIHTITGLSLGDREEFIFNEIKKGNIPMFYRNLSKINDQVLVNGTNKHISYYVIPDYLALGSNDDYFLCPMTPVLGQKIADQLNCILPTKKMVNKIWETSTIKLKPQPIDPSPEMTTIPVFAKHNSIIWQQRKSYLPKDSLGILVSGSKKDVIISNLIHSAPLSNRVIIYGWHDQNGKIIQPKYAGHSNLYVDYSHGIRLVLNKVYIDGEIFSTKDVLKSDKLNNLLSDEGVIQFPNYP